MQDNCYPSPEAGKPETLFITGASGFIGSALLEQLDGAGFESVLLLSRHPAKLEAWTRRRPGWRVIEGELTDASAYGAVLPGVHTVIHLAAATGSATEAELRRVNIAGTERLAAACKSAGVRRLIYLSSIAAAYPEAALRDYPYGRAKLEAERIVMGSGLPYAIVRPTIVLGGRSTNWPMLKKLACLPVTPLFGGGSARIQPVDVVDVARGITAIVATPEAGNSVLELGGPEKLTFAAFMRAIRHASGLAGFRGVPIPVLPIRLALKMLGILAGSKLPVSPGQLTPFICDGTARSNPVFEQIRPSMRSLPDLLSGLAKSGETQACRGAPESECRRFVQYLTSQDPSDYVIRKYVESEAAFMRNIEPSEEIDSILEHFSARGPKYVRIADAYARIFRPRAILRRKLIMTVAILENSKGFHRGFTGGSHSWLPVAVVRIGIALAVFVLMFGLGALLIGPRHLLSAPRSPPR